MSPAVSRERHLAGVGLLTILNLVVFGLCLVAIALLVLGLGPPDWLGWIALGAPVVGALALAGSLKRPRMRSIVAINAVILLLYLLMLWLVFRAVCWGSCGERSPAPAAIEAGPPV